MIRVNCINLESRTERKNHIEIEFSDRHEFNLRIVQAIKHEVGAIGLWQSLIGVVKEMSLYDDEYFIFCEDDHTFTKHYTSGVLQEGIETAKSHNADILLGGVSWLETAVQVSDRMFWVDKYTGNQFVVIFNKFYPVILGITDFENMTADKKYLNCPKTNSLYSRLFHFRRNSDTPMQRIITIIPGEWITCSIRRLKSYRRSIRLDAIIVICDELWRRLISNCRFT